MATTVNTDNTASSIFLSLNPTASTTSTNQVSDQQDRFLKLLTTQLQNQDPLNPMDNAQMTSQLAQISTVDGITKLNATLTQLMGGSTQEQTLLAAALVGHSALVSGSSLELGSSGAVGGFSIDKAADTVTLQIKNDTGTVVRTITLSSQDAGVHNFVWDGKDNNGNALATGTYSLAVTAKQGTADVTASTLSLGTITAVARDSSGTLGVDVGNLGRYTLDQLKQII